MLRLITRVVLLINLPAVILMVGGVLVGRTIKPEMLAFASNRTGNFEIYLYDMRTSVIANISRSPGDDSYPQWNAVDHVLTYWSQRNGRNDEYFVWNPQTKETTRYERKSREQVSEFSPDGKWYVMRSGVSISVNSYGAEEIISTQITDEKMNASEPSWSPDGRSVVFVGEQGGKYDIYTVDIDAEGSPSNLRRLTTHPAVDSHPAWIGN